MNSRLKYKVFKSSWNSWDALFQEACDFANTIGKENVLNISHSCENNEGVIAVWYWEDEMSGQMFGINQVKFGE